MASKKKLRTYFARAILFPPDLIGMRRDWLKSAEHHSVMPIRPSPSIRSYLVGNQPEAEAFPYGYSRALRLNKNAEKFERVWVSEELGIPLSRSRGVHEVIIQV